MAKINLPEDLSALSAQDLDALIQRANEAKEARRAADFETARETIAETLAQYGFAPAALADMFRHELAYANRQMAGAGVSSRGRSSGATDEDDAEKAAKAAKVKRIKAEYDGKTVMHPDEADKDYTIATGSRGRFPEWVYDLYEAGELDKRIKAD